MRAALEILALGIFLIFPVAAIVAYVAKGLRVARWNRLWAGSTPPAVAPALGLPLDDYGGFRITIGESCIELRYEPKGMPEPFWLNLSTNGGRHSDQEHAEPVHLGVAPLDRFLRVREVDRATGQRLRLSSRRLLPLAGLVRRWDSRTDLDLTVETDNRTILNRQTGQWERREESKLRLGFGDDSDALKVKLPPPPELRGLVEELAVAARGLYAAASVPPARPLAQATALLEPRAQQATYWIERPARDPERVTGLELAERVCRGRESPLARVALDGEPAWQHIGARPELAGLFDSRPLDELTPGPRRDHLVHRIVGGLAWLVRFCFVDTKIWLTPAIFGWLVVGACGYDLLEQRRAEESQGWPAAKGRVLSSRVEHYSYRKCSTSTSAGPGQGGPSRHSSSSSCRTVEGYKSVLTYRYTVAGQKYTGDRYAVRLRQKDAKKRSEVEAFLEPFPEGKPVTVYYNPEDPKEAVLRRGSLGEAWWRPWVAPVVLSSAGFFLLLGLSWLWALALRRREPASP